MTFCLPAVRYGEGGGDSEGAASYRSGFGVPDNKWPWTDREGECDPGFFSFLSLSLSSVRLQWKLSPCRHSRLERARRALHPHTQYILSIWQKNGRVLLTPRRDTRWDRLWLWTVRALTIRFIQGLHVALRDEFTLTSVLFLVLTLGIHATFPRGHVLILKFNIYIYICIPGYI